MFVINYTVKNIRVRDHTTGEFWGSAHQICCAKF